MSKQNEVLNEELERGLSERHIQLIALGGAIGVGLFLGSSRAINTAGPALLLAYAFGGIMMFIIMRALGELAVSNPVSGSFAAYANKFIGPLSGYLTGWTYWFMWIVTCMAEITAVGVYMKFWFPDLPQWLPALAALAIMTAVNKVAVKFYGEFEFWFALIKVVSREGKAPQLFKKLSPRQVPANAINVSAAVMLIGVLLNYVLPEKVFTYVTSVATFAAIWTWTVILISQMKFRKSLSNDQIKKLKYPMFGFPIANYISLIFLLFVIVIMWFDPDTRIVLIVGPIWLALLIGVYYAAGINKVVDTSESTKATELDDIG